METATSSPMAPSVDPTVLATLKLDPRRAITLDAIVCLICGRAFRQLTNTHLRSHRTTTNRYKSEFGYNRHRALMCAALARRYAERAIRNGLAARIRRRPIVTDAALRRRGLQRPVALEERLTRSEVARRWWLTRRRASPGSTAPGAAPDRVHAAT
jgi:predicted transcriptional regulator